MKHIRDGKQAEEPVSRPARQRTYRQTIKQHCCDREDKLMKHIQTLDTRDMEKSVVTGGCGECQTSCQSACKTSCGIANQACENKEGK